MSTVNYLGPKNFYYIPINSEKRSESSTLANLANTALSQISRTASTSWETVKGCFVWICPMQKTIRGIRRESKERLETQDIDAIVAALRSERFDLMKDDVSAILERASTNEVLNIINQGIRKGLEEDKALNFRAFDCLDLNQLYGLTGINESRVREVMTQDKNFHLNRIYREKTETPLLRSVTEEVGRFFINLVTTFARMYTDIGGSIVGSGVKIKGGSDEISSLSLPLKLLVCLAAVHWLIDTFIGYELFIAQYALGGALLGLAGNVIFGLIILYPLMVWANSYFSDLPEDVDHWTNEIKKARHPSPEYVTGRNNEIDEIIEYLNQKESIGGKGHVILKGPLGVGKSGIVRGLARRIVLGDVPDFLKGKTVFSLDLNHMPDTSQSTGKVLDRFISATEKYKSKVVVYVNNAHLAWKKNAVEQLRKLKAEYPCLILSMTEEELKKTEIVEDGLIQNTVRYPVQKTGKLETIGIMIERWKKLDPATPVDRGALNEIYETSERLQSGFAQPGRALRVLEEVLKDHRPIGAIEDLTTKKRLQSELEETRNAAFHQHMDMTESVDITTRTNVKGLMNDLEKVSARLKEQRTQVVFLRQIRALAASLEEAKFGETLKLDKPEEAAGKKNWLMLKVALGAINEFVCEKEHEGNGFYRKINEDFVRRKYGSSRKGKEKN